MELRNYLTNDWTNIPNDIIDKLFKDNYFTDIIIPYNHIVQFNRFGINKYINKLKQLKSKYKLVEDKQIMSNSDMDEEILNGWNLYVG